MPEANAELEWTVELGSAVPERRFIVIALAVGAALIGLQIGGLVLCLVGFLAVMLSTAELFLPLRYRLNDEGASVKCGLSVTAIPWGDVKRLIPMKDGVRLSPLAKPSRLDEFRGVYLRYRDNSEEVSGKIRQFWNGDTSALDGGSDGNAEGRASGEDREADPEAEAGGARDNAP